MESATAQPIVTTGPTTSPEPIDPTDEPEATSGTNIWAQDPPTPLLLGAAVRVIVDELNIRRRPDTSARVEGSVSEGTILVIAGMPPVEADGYIWYRGNVSDGDLGGYIATSRGSTPFVSRQDEPCPGTVDFLNVATMYPAERLACFGDQTIEVQGTYGCAGCISHLFGEYKPDWLANPNRNQFLWDVPMEGPALRLRFRPSGPEHPEQGQIVRVRGHFRDEAAANCSIAMDYWWDSAIDIHTVPNVVARLLCRQEFVVESYEVLGTDPRFGAG